MKKLGESIGLAIKAMGGNSSIARINMRAQQVRDRYRQALESVYGPTAEAFLMHTNNVYILDKKGVRTLIVYVDESIFAAELNAQRELIRLRLLELFNESVEDFQICVSKGNYKNNHPYRKVEQSKEEAVVPSMPLNEDEHAFVEETVARGKNDRVRQSMRNAMTADLEWKKGQKHV